MFYVDTSAAMKLLVQEDHSDAMTELYDGTAANDPWVSSDLLRVELMRSMRRVAPPLLPDAEELLDAFDFVELSPRLLTAAMAEPDAGLRALDAIHVATARALRLGLTGFVTYDRDQSAAARDAGLPVMSPGKAT
jgi:hypothetical protein